MIDLVSCFPFELVVTYGSLASSVKLTKVFKLARMVRVGKVLGRLGRIVRKHLSLVSGIAKKALQLLKFVGGIILIVHWIACGWESVGDRWRCLQPDLGDELHGELVAMGDALAAEGGFTCAALSASLARRYTSALLQTCASICGSGVAYTAPEQIYFTFNVIFGAIVQATIFGSVANLLHSLNEDESAFEHKCDLIQYKVTRACGSAAASPVCVYAMRTRENGRRSHGPRSREIKRTLS